MDLPAVMIFCRSRAVAFPPAGKAGNGLKRVKPEAIEWFRDNGKVSFATDLGKYLAERRPGGIKGCSEEATVPEPGEVLTVAQADFIEFLAASETSHHFFLEGKRFGGRRGIASDQ